MPLIDAITLFGIMIVLAAMPSASVALVVTRSATFGVANGLAVSAGIVLGDLVFVALAFFGLTVIATSMSSLFAVIKILGGLYLMWLGISMLRSKSSAKVIASEGASKGSLLTSFVAGFILTLGDIKAIFFYASLLPLFIDLTVASTYELIVIMLITIVSVGSVKTAYALLSNKVASLNTNTKLGVFPKKTAGSFMVCAGGYLVFKA